jgi:cytochrome c-type biogenesis protein CcmH/NrfG
MPAVTLTGLFCAIVLLAAGRRDGEPRALGSGLRIGGVVAVAGLFAFALVALLGNSAVSASSKSADGGRYARAESQAHDAMSFVPWSAEPWRRLGEAQALSGNLAGARVSFRRAVEKDPRDWTLWYELALASRGVGRERALAEAARLNPEDPRLQPQA